jgi:hypothetical protein
MSLLSKLKHEIKEIGLVTLYFFFCFSVMLTIKKLLMVDYRVEVQVLSTAAISALIIAKIVIVLDHTPAGNRFDAGYPLWIVVLYKTLVYLGVAFIVFSLEKLFHVYRETGQIEQAIWEMWEHRKENIMLLKLLCIGLTFLGYHVYAGLDQRLGEGTLRREIFQRPG